jgi:hypothetical protein
MLHVRILSWGAEGNLIDLAKPNGFKIPSFYENATRKSELIMTILKTAAGRIYNFPLHVLMKRAWMNYTLGYQSPCSRHVNI